MLSLKPRPFIQSFFDMQAHTSFFLLLSFFQIGDVTFPEYFLYHCRFLLVLLYGEYVVRFFLPGGVFLPCDHGLDF